MLNLASNKIIDILEKWPLHPLRFCECFCTALRIPNDVVHHMCVVTKLEYIAGGHWWVRTNELVIVDATSVDGILPYVSENEFVRPLILV